MAKTGFFSILLEGLGTGHVDVLSSIQPEPPATE